MDEFERMTQRFELLKIARQMLIEAYINRRAEDHNAWLAESELMWKNNKSHLKYPNFPPYPTEEDVIAKAETLYRFINPPAQHQHPAPPIPEPEPQVKHHAPATPQPSLSPQFADKTMHTPPPPTTPQETNVPIAKPTPTTKSLLPGWVRRTTSDG